MRVETAACAVGSVLVIAMIGLVFLGIKNEPTPAPITHPTIPNLTHDERNILQQRCIASNGNVGQQGDNFVECYYNKFSLPTCRDNGSDWNSVPCQKD